MADVENLLSSYTRKEQTVISSSQETASEMLWYTAHTSGVFLELLTTFRPKTLQKGNYILFKDEQDTVCIE